MSDKKELSQEELVLRSLRYTEGLATEIQNFNLRRLTERAYDCRDDLICFSEFREDFLLTEQMTLAAELAVIAMLLKELRKRVDDLVTNTETFTYVFCREKGVSNG